MHYIIVGCGRVGSELAYRLYQKGHQVSVVDYDDRAFQNLNPNFRGRTVSGEALSQEILQRAGIESADGLVAVTNSDPLNAIVAHIARIAFGIKNIVVRNYDPVFRTLHESFELQIVSSSSWGAQRIEELLYHAEMRTVFSAGNGEIELYEFSIPGTWHGATVGELLAGSNCLAVSLTRAGKAALPNAETVMQEGDVMLASASFEGIEALRGCLQQRKEVQ